MGAESPSPTRCFICGDDRPNSLEEHHIVPRRYGGGDMPENLVHLCASCHAAIEKLYDDEFYRRLGVKAETREGSALEMDVDGLTVEPSDSLDRKFWNSIHVRKEQYAVQVELEELESSSLDEIASQFPQHEEHVKESLDEYKELVLDTLNDEGSPDRFDIPPENKREDPAVVVVRNRVEEITHALTRFHCGYCHTVFSEDEISNLARHLQIIHGIEDPYDESEDLKDRMLSIR